MKTENALDSHGPPYTTDAPSIVQARLLSTVMQPEIFSYHGD